MIGIVDATQALDVDLAAAYLLQHDDDARELAAIKRQAKMNREQALMIGCVSRGIELPELNGEDEATGGSDQFVAAVSVGGQ